MHHGVILHRKEKEKVKKEKKKKVRNRKIKSKRKVKGRGEKGKSKLLQGREKVTLFSSVAPKLLSPQVKIQAWRDAVYQV